MAVVNDPNDYNGHELVTVAAVFIGLSTFAVLLRCYTRLFVTKYFKLDDWLMLVAQVIFSITCAFVFVGVHYGLGHHNVNVPERERIQATKYQALITILYVMNMMFIKLSIGVFLLRIAVHRRYIWILRISMAIIFIWSTVIIFYQFFQCQPVAFQWDPTIPGGKCASGEAFVAAAYSISVMTIVSDWMYSIMPIFMIWNVKMTLQKKITVSLVLGLGVFASVATLVRLKYLIELADYSDQLYTATHAMVWTIIEPGIAIFAASLVTIRPLLNSWNLRGFGSSKNTSNYAMSGYGGGRGISLGGEAGWNKHTGPETDGPSVSQKGGVQSNRSIITAGGSKPLKSSFVGLSVIEKERGGTKGLDTPLGDGSSEEYILENQGVVKTVDVTVSRDNHGIDYGRFNR